MAISIEMALEILQEFRDKFEMHPEAFWNRKDEIKAAVDCVIAYCKDGTTAIWTGNKSYIFEEE